MVERKIVALEVVGSSPIVYPKILVIIILFGFLKKNFIYKI